MLLRHRMAAVWLLWTALSGCGLIEPHEPSGVDDSVPVTCENFCNIMWRHCSGEWRMYPTLDDCRTACELWPNRPEGLSGQGNSLQCRFLYAALAMNARDEAGYCLNANASGGQMCHD